MTYLEKYRQTHPDDGRTDIDIMSDGCSYFCNGKEKPDCVDDDSMNCEKCWESEAVEE